MVKTRETRSRGDIKFRSLENHNTTTQHADPTTSPSATPNMDCSNYFLDTSHIVPFLGMEQPHRFVSSLDARTSPAQHGLDLLSIAKQYSTEELADVWRSSRLDIVEQHTHNVLLRSVPKRMLCLFLGNERYYSLLRTVDEHGRLYPKVKDRYAATQNSVWPRQLLVIPHGTTHHIGWKILVAWMDRACSEQTLFKIHAIKTPEEHFPAACLARTFRFLDFHADAHRVESAILRRLNQHPMPLADMKSVYNCFPDEDLFMYQLVEHLARRIYGYQRGDDAALANVFWVERFVCENPKLKEWVQHALFLVEKEWESRPSSKTCQNYQLRGGGGVDNVSIKLCLAPSIRPSITRPTMAWFSWFIGSVCEPLLEKVGKTFNRKLLGRMNISA